VYPGPIGAIVTPLLKGIENAAPLPFASSLCGACKQACPVDINIPDMLLKLRHDLQSEQEAMWKVGMKAYAFGFSHPLLFEMGGKAASIASRAMTTLLGGEPDEGMPTGDLKLPPPLSGWTQNRDFPPFAQQSFHDWWRKNRSD
jgi:L-lactate dehydrogenase complex protein LldF